VRLLWRGHSVTQIAPILEKPVEPVCRLAPPARRPPRGRV